MPATIKLTEVTPMPEAGRIYWDDGTLRFVDGLWWKFPVAREERVGVTTFRSEARAGMEGEEWMEDTKTGERGINQPQMMDARY